MFPVYSEELNWNKRSTPTPSCQLNKNKNKGKWRTKKRKETEKMIKNVLILIRKWNIMKMRKKIDTKGYNRWATKKFFCMQEIAIRRKHKNKTIKNGERRRLKGKKKGKKWQGKGPIRERGGKELGEVECIQTNYSKIKKKWKVKIGELK